MQLKKSVIESVLDDSSGLTEAPIHRLVPVSTVAHIESDFAEPNAGADLPELDLAELSLADLNLELATESALVESDAGDTIPATLNPKTSKEAIRRSLRASTADGVFATLFSNVTGGALLSSFFLDLGATTSQIGLLAAIPLLANLLQPIGAYLSERVNSRHYYCLGIYGVARSLWVILAVGIGWACWQQSVDLEWLLFLTLAITSVSHALGALGSAAWLSWMAVLVPRRLRGRYFGLRNSAANLTNLISIPLMGFMVSHWWGGSLQGYGIVLAFAIVAGLVSIAFQNFMVDVNPQVQQQLPPAPTRSDSPPHASTRSSLIAFLVYFGFWTFAVNLSGPFFNLYLLDSLHFDVGLVTLYNSLSAAANLGMLVFWGKLADRFGNRPILIFVGVLVAITPLLWLGTSANPNSVWLWFPFLHLLSGATWAAIDLCSGNLQLTVTPIQGQSTYFGIAAAIAGVSGAAGTIAGGFLAQADWIGGILGLFAISSVLRFVALLPLIFVYERHGQPLSQIMRLLFPKLQRSVS